MRYAMCATTTLRGPHSASCSTPSRIWWTAQFNFECTREPFQNGQITGLQFCEARFHLANPDHQAVVAGFDAKMAELTLLRLSGGPLPAIGLQC